MKEGMSEFCEVFSNLPIWLDISWHVFMHLCTTHIPLYKNWVLTSQEIHQLWLNMEQYSEQLTSIIMGTWTVENKSRTTNPRGEIMEASIC